MALRNYINHGFRKNGDVGAARGFAIETLPAITSFKLGRLGTLAKFDDREVGKRGGYLLGISDFPSQVDAIELKLVGWFGGTGVVIWCL